MSSLNTRTKKELNSRVAWEIKEILLAEGWRVIGSGAFSSVFEHDDCPNTVLKVGHYPVVDGWLKWADACKWLNSPHVPKIYAVEKFDHFYFAEIERLQPGADWYNLPASAETFAAEITKMHGCIDCQSANIMLRPSTGEVVFSDPWA